ncbi:MAG TPA: PmeII family type II restriction endonuclease [Fimbriiglobus sp.]|nr:PmeII family type II restriction endonuclease [Fimbriiglobus sp.]
MARKKSPASATSGLTDSRSFYKAVKVRSHSYTASQVAALLAKTDKTRVNGLADAISAYIVKNLPEAIERREGLAEYRTNPYVLLTSATIMQLTNPDDFAGFLFNNKLYMGLETSFGKSIESVLVVPYPLAADPSAKWRDAPEKVEEFKGLVGLTNEEKAEKRIDSVWREVDKSCVLGKRRYLVSIKSGPNCINDTQVKGMTDAIAQQYRKWMDQTKKHNRGVTELDIIIGITYGTDKTTNNKENQILVKLRQHGFEEEDRQNKPGVLIDRETRSVRVYRRIGMDFWSVIGDPEDPANANFVYLEVLLGLAKALSRGMTAASLEERVNQRIQHLSLALGKLSFPRNSLPDWVREEFKEHELTWLAAAMTAFYDEGI